MYHTKLLPVELASRKIDRECILGSLATTIARCIVGTISKEDTVERQDTTALNELIASFDQVVELVGSIGTRSDGRLPEFVVWHR